MDIFGFWAFIGVFVVFNAIALITFLFLTREKFKSTFNYIFDLVIELVYELGKALLTAGLAGRYFIKENEKDFTLGIFSGIIFFITAYILRRSRKEKK